MPVKLAVKAVPGASDNTFKDWLGNELKIRVSAPAENGKADRAIEKLLAKKLGVNANQVRIIRGHRSPHKVFEVDGISEVQLFDMLNELQGG